MGEGFALQAAVFFAAAEFFDGGLDLFEDMGNFLEVFAVLGVQEGDFAGCLFNQFCKI
jgi:hypothetical protein